MRDDVPRSEDSDEESAETEGDSIDVLLLARAVELLPLKCRSALADAYAKRSTTPSVQMIRDGGISEGDVARCEERLTEIFTSLQTANAQEQVPRWVLALENAAIGGHRPQ